MNRVQFIAEQLRKISPGVDWNVAGIDRSIELAQMLERQNITDLWALQLVPVTWREFRPAREAGDAGYVPDEWIEEKGYAFDYYGRRVGFIGEWDNSRVEAVLQNSEYGPRLAWSAEGHGNVSYVLSKNPQTNKLQIRPVWASSSDAGDIRTMAKVIVSALVFTALPLAGVSVGNIIGSAVLPSSIATAYPAIASAVGNIALSAALSGGDVETAVKGAIINSATAGAGQGVGALAELAGSGEFIAALASTATSAALRGDSIKEAVAMTALQKGVPMLEFAFDVLPPDGIGETFGDFGMNYPLEHDFEIPNLGEINPTLAELPTVWDPLPDSAILQAPGNLDFDPVAFDAFDGGVLQTFQPSYAGVPTTPPIVPNSTDSTFSPSNMIQGLTAAALSVIKVIEAYRRLDRPSINTTARNVGPNGAVSVVGNNGLIQTRGPDGRVTAQKPPVGVPQATTTGNYVVNNGNGTYTIVSPDGESRTLSYAPEVASSGSIPWGMLALGAGLLFLARR